ncbi:MAG TPA: nitrogenase stabilizing/protective protein NifW [Xanthobacteraceae bacterium]|nr:nitrogenase stabilizing/protective protein NifW [Xanthobacteraceae bacterium]
MPCVATSPVSANILAEMQAAAAAEDIFRLLDVAFEAKVMNVARLHILKRMGEYLAGESFAEMPESLVAARCKAALERAYDDFAKASPLQHRVFKVLKDAVAPPRPGNFVPFDTLLK